MENQINKIISLYRIFIRVIIYSDKMIVFGLFFGICECPFVNLCYHF